MGLKQSGLPNFQFLNMIDDIKIFVVARDDARQILENRNDEQYQWLIKKCQNDIKYNPVIKA